MIRKAINGREIRTGCKKKKPIDKVMSDMLDTIMIMEGKNEWNDGSCEVRSIDLEGLLNQMHNHWVNLRCEIDELLKEQKDA